MEDEKFDVIVVGAGLAGSSAAYKLAQAGMQVVLIERGPFPGSKNLSGGVLYGNVLNQLIPQYWETAPVERYIHKNVVSFMTKDDSLNIEYQSRGFTQSPYNAFSVLRSKFDRWLAEKAEAEGALIVPGIRVDGLIKDGDQIVGVIAGEEEMRADVIIAADGANSFIAQEAGLQGKIAPSHLAIGIKALISLSSQVIEERFNLTGNEGEAFGFVGQATDGIPGGGFLYTNKDSISIGLVFHLDALIERKITTDEILDDFLEHPSIEPLIRGGRLIEYGAHLIPEGGKKMMPKLYSGGILVTGDAAGLSLNNGFVVRGMDLAIASGIVAAETIIDAKKQKDYSENGLRSYTNKLMNSFIMADLQTYSRAPNLMKNEHLYKSIPEILTGIMNEIYSQQTIPKKHLVSAVFKSLKESNVPLIDLVEFLWQGGRSL